MGFLVANPSRIATIAFALVAGPATGGARPCAAQGLLSGHAVAAPTIARTTITGE
jgi:hypothetical protein